MNDLDPQISAELDALEAALNGEPGADPVLVALVEDVRGTAAPMPPSLKTRLEERAVAGFPRERATRPERGRLPRWALPAMGATATVIVAVVVATGALRDGGTQTLSGGGSGGDTAALSEAAPPASGGAYAQDGDADAARDAATKQAAPAQSDEAAQSAGTGAGTALPSTALASPISPPESVGRERKVERAVDLTLRVGSGQLEDTADGVVRTTQQLGGYVSTSSVSARGSGGSASFVLRVPTARLDEAIKQLSKLGHVAALDQSSRDITGAFVSVEDRLSDARQERKALLRALGKAQNAGQIATIKQRLRYNRSEIAQYKGQLDALRRRANLSTISVEIVARGKASVAPGGDEDWSPGDAARDALRVLEVAAGVALIALAALVPLALIAALAALTARSTRRRRREHALDAT